MHRPVFKWKLFLHATHRLVQRHHKSLDEKAPTSTERIPEIKLSRVPRSTENSTFKDAAGSESLIDCAPPNIRFVPVLVKVFVAGIKQDFSSVFVDVDLNLAEFLQVSAFLRLLLKRSSHVIQALEPLRPFCLICLFLCLHEALLSGASLVKAFKPLGSKLRVLTLLGLR